MAAVPLSRREGAALPTASGRGPVPYGLLLRGAAEGSGAAPAFRREGKGGRKGRRSLPAHRGLSRALPASSLPSETAAGAARQHPPDRPGLRRGLVVVRRPPPRSAPSATAGKARRR